MPRISDRHLKSVVYFYPSKMAADEGASIGGSGFIVGVPTDPPDNSQIVPVFITNKHVIDGGNEVARLNTAIGVNTIDLSDRDWFHLPSGEDVVACPAVINDLSAVSYIFPWSLITEAKLDELDIGPGDDVFFIGRFTKREGQLSNTPTARFGNIAQMPTEPMTFDGGISRPPCFLVEARSISGFSGSPVFVHFPSQPAVPDTLLEQLAGMLPRYVTARQFTHLGLPFDPPLLGIDFCHIYTREPLRDIRTTERNRDWYVKSNTGMMGVVPAWKLTELLEREDVRHSIDLARRARYGSQP
ncbi:MAG: trypsin-like peptidase domain-containing protein [Pseudolabrys sp.]|nr:trypsin-like peptidase domain-containing protein [Pseudolabrys sp.]